MNTKTIQKTCYNCGAHITKGIICPTCDAIKYCAWHVEDTFPDPQTRLDFAKSMQEKGMGTWLEIKKEAVKTDSHLLRTLYKFFRRIILPLPYYSHNTILGRAWLYVVTRAESEQEARVGRDNAQRMAMQAVTDAMEATETTQNPKTTHSERAYSDFDFAQARAENIEMTSFFD